MPTALQLVQSTDAGCPMRQSEPSAGGILDRYLPSELFPTEGELCNVSKHSNRRLIKTMQFAVSANEHSAV
jgi:hypothetical protein